MKRLKLFVLWVGVVCGLGYLAVTVARAGAERRSSPKTVERGRAVFAANCARCHGGDGCGQTTLGKMVEAPDLTRSDWQKQRSDARLVNSVTRGRGQMPAFGKRLSKEEIAAVVAYVRTLRR